MRCKIVLDGSIFSNASILDATILPPPLAVVRLVETGGLVLNLVDSSPEFVENSVTSRCTIIERRDNRTDRKSGRSVEMEGGKLTMLFSFSLGGLVEVGVLEPLDLAQ